MALAHRLHGGEIAGQGGGAAERGADDRLGAEGDDVLGSQALELGLEFGGEPRDVVGVASPVPPVAIGEAGRDMAEGVRQDRRIGRAAHGVAAGGKRAPSVLP